MNRDKANLVLDDRIKRQLTIDSIEVAGMIMKSLSTPIQFTLQDEQGEDLNSSYFDPIEVVSSAIYRPAILEPLILSVPDIIFTFKRDTPPIKSFRLRSPEYDGDEIVIPIGGEKLPSFQAGKVIENKVCVVALEGEKAKAANPFKLEL